MARGYLEVRIRLIQARKNRAAYNGGDRHINKLIFVLLLFLPAAVVAKDAVQYRRTVAWAPSQVLIDALDLKSVRCDESGRSKARDALADEQSATAAQRAASAALDAMLAARKLPVPEEYDAVWLDYQTAMAMYAAGRLEQLSTLVELLKRPRSQIYEEQIFATTFLSLEATAPASELLDAEICFDQASYAKALEFPEEPMDLGLNGWVVLRVELRPDQKPGRRWVVSSSHSAYEQAALDALKTAAPTLCKAGSATESLFATLPVSFDQGGPTVSMQRRTTEAYDRVHSFKPGQGAAMQLNIAAMQDPIFTFRSLKAYRDVDDQAPCRLDS